MKRIEQMLWGIALILFGLYCYILYSCTSIQLWGIIEILMFILPPIGMLIVIIAHFSKE